MKKLINALLLPTAISTVLMSQGTLAMNFSDHQAQGVVEQYRQLRLACAQQVNEARRDCFARLNAQNDNYQEAKKHLQKLKSTHSEEPRAGDFRLSVL